MRLRCTVCHTTAERAERAGFPEASQCLVCHKEMPAKPFPTHRTHKLADFVFFTHARHAVAKLDCQSCHGPVAERAPTTMKACIACHKARRATEACNACHELSQ